MNGLVQLTHCVGVLLHVQPCVEQLELVCLLLGQLQLAHVQTAESASVLFGVSFEFDRRRFRFGEEVVDVSLFEFFECLQLLE